MQTLFGFQHSKFLDEKIQEDEWLKHTNQVPDEVYVYGHLYRRVDNEH